MPEVDEFSFLSAQAAEIGRPAPTVERVRLTLEDGRTVSALRWGDAPPAVTLLHGAGLNAHTWDTTLLHLGLPALALDLPGHGDSSWRDDAAYVARVLAPDVVTA
ncbi:MAG: putative hydrolase or acyltransferase, partial [Microbacterium sp.]|nr:putative hydrolase or acyltransferase [Microbacterium sp.]